MAGSLELNKVLGAVLTGGIIAVGSIVIADILYGPNQLYENAFNIDMGEGTEVAEADEAPAGPEPIAALLASADIAEGEKVAKKCAACHAFEEGGPNKVGPGLWNVVGRPVGAHDGFSYSDAVGGHGGEWTFEELNGFLWKPKEWIPGTSMGFAGLRKPEERADLIAYLRSLSADPVPLPDGEAAAPDAAAPDATQEGR